MNGKLKLIIFSQISTYSLGFSCELPSSFHKKFTLIGQLNSDQGYVLCGKFFNLLMTI